MQERGKELEMKMILTPTEKNMIMAYRKADLFSKILVERFFKDCLYSDISNTNELRTNKGISVAMLAQEIGLSVSSVQQYESGKRYPSRKVQRIIADYFGVEIDYLIGKTEADDIKKIKTFKLSDEARAFEFLRKYRNADDTTKEIVDKLISREEQELSNSL